jgi:formate transporter FocA
MMEDEVKNKSEASQSFSIDALVPKEMAAKMENVGVAKVGLGPLRMFALAVLAGAFIALGAIFATTATTGAAGAIPFGVAKVLGGLVFSLGLILVVGAGAELFTGNNLIVMGWASGKVATLSLLRNWAIVYVGNFTGSILTAYMMFLSKQFTFADGAIGLNALNIASGKVSYDFLQAVVLGILCNALVCLAVWLAIGARSVTDKILAIIFPISAFVAAGFEHSIANMYFIPTGLLIKNGAAAGFWEAIGRTPADFAGLTWGSFFIDNLLPVTIGNIIGGALMVGLVYWFIYLRPDWVGRKQEEEGAVPSLATRR